MLNNNTPSWNGRKAINENDEKILDALEVARREEFKQVCKEHSKSSDWINTIDPFAPITSFTRLERKMLARFVAEAIEISSTMPKHIEFNKKVQEYAYEDYIVYYTHRKRIAKNKLKGEG